MTGTSILSYAPKQRALVLKALLVLVVLAALLWTAGSEAMFGLDLSEYQLVALPLVWLVLWKLRAVGVAVSRGAFVLAIVGTAVSIGYSRFYVPDKKLALVMSRLGTDEFEIKTRHFRDLLDHEVARADLPVALRVERSALSFSSHKEALRFLNSAEHLPAVVWGTTRWINVSLHPERTATLRREELEPWISMLGFEIVSSVPVVGLSKEPPSDTARFLVSAMGGLFTVKAGAQAYTLAKRGFAESDLLGAATQQSPWSSFSHRALPWFILGNRYLTQALKGGGYDAGEMRCAISAYTRARRALRAGDNPELLAAALNNRAFAHAVMSLVERSPGLKVLIRKELRAAARASKEKNLYRLDFRAPKVAKLNLQMLERKARARHVRGGKKRGEGHEPKVKKQKVPKEERKRRNRLDTSLADRSAILGAK